MTRAKPQIRHKVVISICGALFVLAALVPASVMGAIGAKQSYMVVMKGAYALDGTYALGQGYALVGQTSSYALRRAARLCAGRSSTRFTRSISRTRCSTSTRSTSQFAQSHNYRLFGQYALNSGYALDTNYALGQGYALAALTGYVRVSTPPTLLTNNTAGATSLAAHYALLDEYALGDNYALARDYALYDHQQRRWRQSRLT